MTIFYKRKNGSEKKNKMGGFSRGKKKIAREVAILDILRFFRDFTLDIWEF